MDFDTDSKVQETIRTEFVGNTLICIAHRLRTVIDYDKVLVLGTNFISTNNLHVNRSGQTDGVRHTAEPVTTTQQHIPLDVRKDRRVGFIAGNSSKQTAAGVNCNFANKFQKASINNTPLLFPLITTSYSSCQLHVFLHNSDTLGMDGTEIGILKQVDQISFCCFLQGEQGMTLPSETLIGTL